MRSGSLSRRRLLGLGGVAAVGTALAVYPTLEAFADTGTDLVVYGATPAGLMAAIQAVRMGRTAVVLEPSSHVGGLTTGGLGFTDVGAPDTIGGLAGEFYRRIGKRYGTTDGPRFVFEPSVAAAVLGEMLAEAGLTVQTGAQLRTVTRSANRITALVTTDGVVHQGRMFVDATYEGDLMAAASVTSTVGREANSQYGETLNGVQLHATVPGETFVDPYVVAGQKSSGLLPGISAGPVAPNGSADSLTQAYNFRMCLTQSADRIPFPKPDGYDPADHELLRRYIVELGSSGPFFSTNPVGGGKVDANNFGPYSSDFIGKSHAYPTASRAQRDSIVAAHRAYQQGQLYFLANDPRLPAKIRSFVSSWGLPADEFTGNGGWSPQLYVREARRMRSDYVMNEHDCRGERTATDSVGLASYGMDSHSVQRVVVDGGIHNEGWLEAAPPGPFPISFRSIVPRQAECSNLLVPVCVAASHVAYASIRMEPVFMVLGQSAGTAAALAIQANSTIQQVPYKTLSAKQVLTWPPLPAGEIVVDNANYTGVEFRGGWSTATGINGYFAADFAIGDRSHPWSWPTCRFTPTLPKAGRYTVYLRWTAAYNRASAVPVDVVHSTGTATRTVNMRQQGGQWVSLGTYSFLAGKKGSVLIRGGHTNGYVIADAVRFAPA
jgi:ribulose 1,5-bisphosphate synthetase/thiazole synthase